MPVTKRSSDIGMKSGVNVNGGGKIGSDEEDDVFGGPRSYATGFCGGRSSRPTMISAKYRQKEERRKVLKISINKLKKIEDPESSLRRSVLINNTMKKLQKEAREEKLQKQRTVPSNYDRCFTSDFLKDNENPDEPAGVPAMRSSDQLVDITNLPEANTVKSPTPIKSYCGFLEDARSGRDESMTNATDPTTPAAAVDNTPDNASRKRLFDDVDDCDVQAVLSQFYMPPTPRMLTSIDEDEDEDVNVVDLDSGPCEKRPRLEGLSAADRLKTATRGRRPESSTQDLRHRLTMAASGSDTISERSGGGPSGGGAFSCGHSSMFNELQSVVYHSLITSLET